jgi:peptidoglycan/LPS O-acetylase OafA/YrhL
MTSTSHATSRATSDATGRVTGRHPAGTALTSEDPAGGSFRPDIQGLRAVAVTLVVLYHLWPGRVPGGFVGVDVFFVISGFLITTHLVAHPATGPRQVASFWARRVRRLLPASFLVLAVTLVASRVVAPETEWDSTARETAGASLYVVNWLLAHSQVSYLSAQDPPTPVQHYWSLSVEEQFYLVWPLLILALTLVAARVRVSRMRAVCAGLAVVSLASLAYSVRETAYSATTAYFVTPTRVWELGLGGLLAALVLWSRDSGGGPSRVGLPVPRAVVVVLGLVAIVWSAWTYSDATPFPGWRAAVPVLGAVLVIVGGTGAEASRPVSSLLDNRVAQWLGDASYSIYLWHWPLVVLVPYVSGGRLGLLDKTAIILLTLVLAALTKALVEDRFRRPRSRRLRPTFVFMVVGIAVILAMSALQLREVGARRASAVAAVQKALAGHGRCFGAAALVHGCPLSDTGAFVPAPAQAAEDRSRVYEDRCYELEPFKGTTSCTYGDPHGRTDIAVIGNSHAIQWMPAIDRIAHAEGWKVTTFLDSECTPSTVVNTQDQWNYAESARNCLAWGRRVQKRLIAGDFDLVVMSNSSGGIVQGAEDRDQSMPIWTRGYRDWLRPVVASGERVTVLKDTPWAWTTLDVTVPECVAAHMDDRGPCDGPRREWLRDDPAVAALRGLDADRVGVIDMSDDICTRTTCPAVVGGVLAYQDGHHLTRTYVESLAPLLAPHLVEAVEGR